MSINQGYPKKKISADPNFPIIPVAFEEYLRGLLYCRFITEQTVMSEGTIKFFDEQGNCIIEITDALRAQYAPLAITLKMEPQGTDYVRKFPDPDVKD